LGGRITNEIFEFDLDASGQTEILEVCYGTNRSSTARTETFGSLRNVERHEVKAGSAYCVARGLIHKAEPLECPSATLVVTTDEDTTAPAKVFVGRGLSPLQPF